MVVVVVALGVVGGLVRAVSPPAPAPAVSSPPQTAQSEPAPASGTEAAPVEAAATVTAADAVSATFGDFKAFTKKGRGDSVVSLPSGATAAIVTASHTGSSNFTIEVLDARNSSTDLLVNTIGRYAGTTMYEGDQDAAKRLKIGADGSWKITILPVSKARPMSIGSNSGIGDCVLLYDGEAADWDISHRGQSNFAIKTIGTDGGDLLVNEIGRYSGTVPVGAGPMVVVLSADGRWSISVQK